MSGVHVEWGTETPARAEQIAREIDRLTDRLRAIGATRVVLFGSRARGAARAGSDIDLIAVMPCDPSWTFARRLAEVGAAIDPRLATDLLVYTPEEYERMKQSSCFLRQALANGKVLFQAE